MSLIDKTYFVRDCNLPTGAYNDIPASLTRYERDILIQLLGYDLAKLVLAYNSGTSPQRIKDIVEGKEYTEGSYTVKWNGLVNTEKVSILAYYTYIQYITDHSVDFQNIGAMAGLGENAVNVGPGVLVQRASVRLSELAGYPYQDTYAASLYNFLTKHPEGRTLIPTTGAVWGTYYYFYPDTLTGLKLTDSVIAVLNDGTEYKGVISSLAPGGIPISFSATFTDDWSADIAEFKEIYLVTGYPEWIFNEFHPMNILGI